MKPRLTVGNKNLVGQRVLSIRSSKGIKQKDFLARLQTLGMDISATSLSRLEGQQRQVADYELVILARALDLTVEQLLPKDEGVRN